MPRVSEADKRKSHERILAAAARLLRERGIGATSVGDVMKAAGMTHGGFYRHFQSKDDLVAAAFEHAVDGVVHDMEAAPSAAARRASRETYLDTYLSMEHVRNRAQGCPLASLANELARAEHSARGAAASASTRMASLLNASDDRSSTQGRAMMALLMGTVSLARLADTDDEAGDLLEAGKKALSLIQRHWDQN